MNSDKIWFSKLEK